MTLALQLLWLALPIVAAGLVHLAVLKLDLLPGLRRLPIDGGLTFRGRRLFGDNKTWRGAVVTVGTTTAAAWLLAAIHDCCWSLPTLVPFAETHPLASGQGVAGRTFWVIDQLDSLAGMLLFVAPVWRPSLALLALIVAIMLVAHPIGAWIMVLFGLKDRVG